MKILVINPIGHSKWDNQDKKIYESFVSPGTTVDVVSLPQGPITVESPEAYAEVIPLVIKRVLEYYEKYDGFIINCFLDPGVKLLRGIIRKPVIGPCEASMSLASLITDKIGIVSVGSALWMIEDHIRSLGYANRLIGLEGIDLGVLDLDKDLELTISKIVERSKKLIDRGAEVIVLGCTGFAGLARKIEEHINIPVIDPAGAAVKILESLIKLNIYNPRAATIIKQ